MPIKESIDCTSPNRKHNLNLLLWIANSLRFQPETYLASEHSSEVENTYSPILSCFVLGPFITQSN